MRNLIGLTILFLVLPTSAANADSSTIETVTETVQQKTPVKGMLPAAKGRLKFKSAGPMCICGEGLSERDIAQQQIVRSKSGEVLPDIAGDHNQSSNLQNNINTGVAK
jgi:hypothetical protein